MQTYKFKAYIKELGKVYDVLSLHAPFPGEDFQRAFINKPLEEGEVKNYRIDGVDNHLMMWTGKYSKDNQEIWIGHIVIDIFGTIGVIEWHKNSAWAVIRYKDNTSAIQPYCFNDISFISEILGNKFENPELLTQ